MKNEERDIYTIPPNFIEGGTLLGGMFRTRNVVEAGILAVAIGGPGLSLPLFLTPPLILFSFPPPPLALVALPPPYAGPFYHFSPPPPSQWWWLFAGAAS